MTWLWAKSTCAGRLPFRSSVGAVVLKVVTGSAAIAGVAADRKAAARSRQ